MKRFLCVILVFVMLIPFTVFADAKNIEDTSTNWRYIVPFCKYAHCEILSNGLIKIGEIIGGTSMHPVFRYGLLDCKGKPLTDIIYDNITSPNNDGYMVATIEKTQKFVLFDKSGKIIPTPKGAIYLCCILKIS